MGLGRHHTASSELKEVTCDPFKEIMGGSGEILTCIKESDEEKMTVDDKIGELEIEMREDEKNHREGVRPYRGM